MKRNIRILMALLITMIIVIDLFPNLQGQAKEITLAVPTIKVKAANNSTAIKITISKTKDAEGYEVYIAGKTISYVDYRNVDEYNKVAEIAKDGKAKRTITIKSLPSGSYKVKVRSYNFKKYGTEKYSEFSKEKSVKLKSVVNGYNDSYDFSKVKEGDTVTFGSYEQDGDFTNGREPIEWIVLEKTKKQIFVVSKYAIDTLPYNKTNGPITWENCTLRKWLNDKFYANAFNKTEQGMIKTTKVDNYNNAVRGTEGGNDTKDKVFLLSQLDSINPDYGFSEEYDPWTYDENRLCVPTQYTINQGVYIDPNIRMALTSDVIPCDWWLRTPGYTNDTACEVDMLGRVISQYVHVDSNSVFNSSTGVRPAMVISLTSK